VKALADCAACLRPRGDCGGDLICRVQAADRYPTWCDRGPVNALNVTRDARTARAAGQRPVLR